MEELEKGKRVAGMGDTEAELGCCGPGDAQSQLESRPCRLLTVRCWRSQPGEKG